MSDRPPHDLREEVHRRLAAEHEEVAEEEELVAAVVHQRVLDAPEEGLELVLNQSGLGRQNFRPHCTTFSLACCAACGTISGAMRSSVRSVWR